MAKPSHPPTETAQPLVMSRFLRAPPERVFQAWSSADHLRRWFCPATFTVPEAVVEFRVGGAFDICMRSPEGHDHWTRGRYTEIVPHSRLVIDMQPGESDGQPLFHAHTVVSFAAEADGTRLDVTQSYTILNPMAAPMIQGAPQGWGQTLDRLEVELQRNQQSPPAQRHTVHAAFTIERRYAASVAQVFKALTDPIAKAKWFTGGSGYTVLVREMDVRSGGRERLQGRWPSGVVTDFEAVYHDVVPNERLVYSYQMHLDERKISVSLATVELRAVSDSTQLVMTEQGAFLDGYEDAGSRERGTNSLLDALGNSLA
jgi:uncharacterized protein YndB with AHSA1/START domain